MLDMQATPGSFGMALLKRTTPRAWWWQESDFDFGLFAAYPCQMRNWYTGKVGPHSYDKHKAYLGAAGGVKLGVGLPTYYPAPNWWNVPGLWHLQILKTPTTYPASLPPIVESSDTWEYTPMVGLLFDLGFTLHLEEAYLFETSHQVLRNFYDEIRTLLLQYADDSERLGYIKLAYCKTFGMLAHEVENPWKGNIYRPDWCFSIAAHSKANMLRHVVKVYEQEGVTPAGFGEQDHIYYPSAVNLPLGATIGKFAYEYLGDNFTPHPREGCTCPYHQRGR